MKSNQHTDCPSAPNLQAHRALSPLPSTLATAFLTLPIHSALLLIAHAHHTSLPRGSRLSRRLFLSGLVKVHFSCAAVLAEARDIVLCMQFPLLPVVPHPHLSIHPFTAALTLALCSVCTYSGHATPLYSQTTAHLQVPSITKNSAFFLSVCFLFVMFSMFSSVFHDFFFTFSHMHIESYSFSSRCCIGLPIIRQVLYANENKETQLKTKILSTCIDTTKN